MMEPDERGARPTSMCPTPNKRRFSDLEKANARLQAIQQWPHTDYTPVRAYECLCGGAHLTHHKLRAGV